MSQLIDVSNIAMPMLEIEVAIRITVNARWPNTPSREGEGPEPLDALPDVVVKEFDPDSTALSLLQLAQFGNDPHAID